ncbi:hypothetical protein FNF27_04446 [Cafeteria roenbergensis]|uniref:Calpain catalytic domain-containing protein n=1 Tax=Cafeteria roenbergensis TaxID=33653 RepID=A0A5A8EDM9_CAFRO|nr:hypothetical protein FNF27_04446 [Cafeteria roenbergensis]
MASVDEETAAIENVRRAQSTVPSLRHSDTRFPADNRSLALLDGAGGAPAVDEVTWERPDVVARNQGDSGPVVVHGEFGESAMVQGLLGDRYFLAALAAVARAAAPPGSEPGTSRVESLLTTPDEDIEQAGVVAGQFYVGVSAGSRRPGTAGRSSSRSRSRAGTAAAVVAAQGVAEGPRWETAVTDTRLPHVAKPGSAGEEHLPLYGCGGTGSDGTAMEAWVGLLEKAYAAFWSQRRWVAPRPSSRAGRGAGRDAAAAAAAAAGGGAASDAAAQAAAAVGYRAVHRGGSMGSALVDLTGGSVETALLRSPRVAAALRADAKLDGRGARASATSASAAGGAGAGTAPRAQSESLWELVSDHVSRGHIVAATAGGPDGLPAVGTGGEAPGAGAAAAPTVLPLDGAGSGGWDPEQGISVDSASGLLRLHPYPVLWAGEPRRGLRMVKLSNPWTRQEEFLGAGWSGDWGPESELWAEHPDVEAELNARAAAGEAAAAVNRSVPSEFWMAWEDAATHFASLTVCRLADVGAAPRPHLGNGARNGLSRGYGVGRGRGAALPAGSTAASPAEAVAAAAAIATASLDAGVEDAAATAAAVGIASRLGIVGPPTARPAQLLASARRAGMPASAGPVVAPVVPPVAGMRAGPATGSGDGGDEVLAIAGMLAGRAPRAASASEAAATLPPGVAPCISLTRRVPLPTAAALSARQPSTALSAAVATAAAGAGLPVPVKPMSAAAAIRLATEWSAEVAGGGACPVPGAWLRPDGDARFFMALQFRIVGPRPVGPGQAAPPPTDILLSLSQLDPRQRRRILPPPPEEADDAEEPSAQADTPSGQKRSGAGGAAGTEPGSSAGGAGSGAGAGDIPRGVGAAVRACVPVEFVVLRRGRQQQGRVWELSEAEVVATSQSSLFAPPADLATGMPVPRELVLPALRLEPDSSYVVAVSLAPPPPLPVGMLAAGAGGADGADGAAGGAMAARMQASPGHGGDGDAMLGTPAGQAGAAAGAASGAATGPASIYSELDAGEELPVALRVFAPVGRAVAASALPAPTVVAIKGRWTVASGTACGAPVLPNGSANGSWGMGPQALLRVDVDAAKRADRLAAAKRARPVRRGARGGSSRGGRGTAGRRTADGVEADEWPAQEGRDGEDGELDEGAQGGAGAEAEADAVAPSLSSLARPGARIALKLVLRRTDRGAGRDEDGGVANRVGMVICRAARVADGAGAVSSGGPGAGATVTRLAALSDVARSRTGGSGSAGKAGATGGLGATGRTATMGRTRDRAAVGDTLGAATMRSTGRGGQGAPGAAASVVDPAALDDLLGRSTASVDDFCRRKAVTPAEWAWSTDWRGHAVATASIKVPAGWVTGGQALSVHPMLRLPGSEGAWALEVHGTVPMALDMLREPGQTRVEGAWEGRSAAGCQLHTDWLRNPAFFLSPSEADAHGQGAGGEVPYTLTIERPAGPWARAVKRDGVGTMVGLYVLAVHEGAPELARLHVRAPGDPPATDPSGHETSPEDLSVALLVAKTTFVPMERASLPLQVRWTSLLGARLRLVVVCCTYGAGFAGPFRLEVESPPGRQASLTPYEGAQPEVSGASDESPAAAGSA